MPDVETAIPKRALFRAAEVCELAKVPAYVLRSWEVEFTDLGVAKSPGGTRVYRRGDVERVLRIKHLLYDQGLTLAGARRRLAEEVEPRTEDTPIEELLGRHARERLVEVRDGLRDLLSLLAGGDRTLGGGGRLRLAKEVVVPERRPGRTKAKGSTKGSRSRH